MKRLYSTLISVPVAIEFGMFTILLSKLNVLSSGLDVMIRCLTRFKDCRILDGLGL